MQETRLQELEHIEKQL